MFFQRTVRLPHPSCVKRSHILILLVVILADVAFVLWYLSYARPHPAETGAPPPLQFRATSVPPPAAFPVESPSAPPLASPSANGSGM
jgi:hypothetical protein